MFPESAAMRNWTKLEYTTAEDDLADRFSTAIRQFAHGQKAPWVPYDSKEDASLQWEDDRVRVALGYHQNHCDLLESLGLPWGLLPPEPEILV